MELKEIIARGNTAEVYATDNEERVLKLFFPHSSRETVEHEFINTKIMNDMPFSKPRVYEMTEINGRFGIVYERIPAETLLNYALANGCTPEWIGEKMAEQHAAMLACACNAEIETDKAYYTRFISYSTALTDEEKALALSMLAALSSGNSLCHGDFHPQNITTDGEKFTIIDFMNVYISNPNSDVARTYYLVALSPIPDEIPPEQRGFFADFKQRVGDTYTRLMENAGFADWRKWLPVIIAARSGDGIQSPEKQHAARLFREHIK